ncbi:hypothetical protein E2C01_028017 [Portunus trituberculatus]|uniref:RNA-directed DNA polymerase n=1 Tax=Portunus trituberculatus TaxID=210409 RepID=A0A5B7EJL2_PORTR|nr:hypothetical protein [Portunus trituberculatus]
MEDDKLYRCRRGNWVEIVTSPSQAYEILKIIHEANGSHIGIVKTKSRVSMKYYWYGMSHDVIDYVSLCLTCQQSEKFKKPSHTSTQTISDPLEIEGMELSGKFLVYYLLYGTEFCYVEYYYLCC